MSKLKTTITPIIGGIYRIATYVDGTRVSFNQFLIDDERPMLVHTGEHGHYESIRAAIAQVLDPAKLAFVALLHFEGDECGGLDRFMQQAPEATLVSSAISAGINLARFPWSYRILGVTDGDRVELGRHTLRTLETPHVHHWDSMMFVEEATNSLFPSDLFLQTGDQPAVVREDLSEDMCAFYRYSGIFASETPVRALLDRLDVIRPAWAHAMHGGSLEADTLAAFTRALREQPFAYDGSLFARRIG